MGDEVTCPVCGRGLSVKGHLKPGLSYDCVKLGYERSQEALAAARRECAKKDEALDRCHDLFSDIRGDWTDPRSQCREGMAVCRAALAAPAAGEEGT